MSNNNEEDFFDKYTCIDNPFTEDGNYDNKSFETYGEEYEAVKKACENTPKRVWTLLDNNSGWMGVVAGWHYINRVCYFITEEEWENENEQYTFYDTTELREQWEKFPRIVVQTVIENNFSKESVYAMDDEEYEKFLDDNFYQWEELGEEERDKIIKQYGIQ